MRLNVLVYIYELRIKYDKIKLHSTSRSLYLIIECVLLLVFYVVRDKS